MLGRFDWLARSLCACAGLAALACRAADPELPARPITPPELAHAPRTSDYDVESYDLELELFPGRRAIQGTCRIRLWSQDRTLESVDLDLDDLEVSAVRGEGGLPLTFERRPASLRIELREPLPPRHCTEVAIDYGGVPRKGLYFVVGSDGAPTQVFTHGECEDSRGWFPCFDAPSDRATSQLCVTMPAGWTSLAAGERLERVEREGRATERWRMSVPHPTYLTTLVAGEFAIETGSFEGTPLAYLSEERLAPEIEPNLGRTPDVLRFVADLTGLRYPYPKYTQACVAGFPFAGMENVSATTLSDSALQGEKGRRDASSIGLVVHEAAHQWFGNLLTCRDWSHTWLNEGFATYADALFTERDRGVDEFRARMRELQDAYVRADVGANRRPIVHAVYRRPQDLFFSGHVYAGAAVRLHLLRSLLGDEAFFRGVRLYVGRHAGRSVVTDDLRRAMEAAGGADLGWFFEQWFEKPGFPEIQSSWRYDEKRRLVLLTVNQVQEISDGTPGAFRMPVEIGVRESQGTRSVILEVVRRRHLFEIPAATKPISVRFDEHGFVPKLLEERKAAEEWLAIAMGDGDVNGRRDAASALAKLARMPAPDEAAGRSRAAIRGLLVGDPSAHVRAAAAAGLAEAGDAESRSALSSAASGDAEAGVRCAALDALRGYGPAADLSELALREYAAAFSWGTMASAAALHVAADPEHAVDWLCAEIERAESPDALRFRLIPVLAITRDPRALSVLLRIATDGRAGDNCRAAAARHIGILGRGDPRSLEVLESLLSAASWHVRLEAIAALSAQGSRAALEPLRDRHVHSAFGPEHTAIEAALRSAEQDG